MSMCTFLYANDEVFIHIYHWSTVDSAWRWHALQALMLLHLLAFRWFCTVFQRNSIHLGEHFVGFYSFIVAFRFVRSPQPENHSLLLSKPKWMCFFLFKYCCKWHCGNVHAFLKCWTNNDQQQKKLYFKQQFASNRKKRKKEKEREKASYKKFTLKMQRCALRSSSCKRVTIISVEPFILSKEINLYTHLLKCLACNTKTLF